MKVTIKPYGDCLLEIDGAIFKTKDSVETFIKTLRAASKIVWPAEKEEKK